jgi:hypothetical protein
MLKIPFNNQVFFFNFFFLNSPRYISRITFSQLVNALKYLYLYILANHTVKNT